MRRAWLWSLLVAGTATWGCGATAPAAPPAAKPVERPYLKLIEPDNAWTLPIQVSSGHFAKRPGELGYVRDQHAAGTLHCRVAELAHVGEAAVARLACDKPYDDLAITGTWVAQPAGLYHPLGPITQPDDLSTLVDEDLLIQAHPRERDHTHSGDGRTRRVEATAWKQGGWCVQDKTWPTDLETGQFGDRRSFIVCFDGSGIAAASEYDTVAAGGMWRSVQIGRGAPIDFDDPQHPTESCDDCGD